MTHSKTKARVPKRIPFRMHPRVFAALGADLVTNDVVAVIEIVKNSYDAFATKAWVRFGTDPHQGQYLEVEDNGCGMDRATIEDVWCLVATPYRRLNPTVTKGKKKRRVAGEKGLGRLAVARLGDRLEMLTQAEGSPCWRVTVAWSDFSESDDMAACYAVCEEFPEPSPFRASGTRVRIYGLKNDWDEARISDLEENLARLISPFFNVGDFGVLLVPPGSEGHPEEIKIESPAFLSTPKYQIAGHLDPAGNVYCKYVYSPVKNGGRRRTSLQLSWEQVCRGIEGRSVCDREAPGCGPFEFEIRAWDIRAVDTQEIAERYEMPKSQVRKAIRAHKGISVYRDGILALPKSESSRDWLGLDLRRVSKVGPRLSTSQIVGYVSISGDDNPKIRDTSDREGFVSEPEVIAFQEILIQVVSLLENERNKDRPSPQGERPLEELFEDLCAEDLLSETIAIAEEDAPASDAVPLLREFRENLDKARAAIQQRFVFYSRLATVGTIAQMIVHEIRNRTTALGSFLRAVEKSLDTSGDEVLSRKVELAKSAIGSLERLSDTFAPLASRAFRRRKRDAVLEESIKRCLTFVAGDISRMGIEIKTPGASVTRVAVDPGELDAILLNLIANAVYWLDQVPKDRKIEFRLSRLHEGKRARVHVHDTGPGVHDDDVDRIFWPGVTRKPDGIGMGLTVASELVAEYGGQMCTIHPGKLGGATFAFDVPVKA